jgi:Protein of unknown function (DUF4199)
MKKLSLEFKWAIIFVAMSLIWMLLEKLAGLHSTHIDKHSTYTNLIAIPAITVYVFALLEKKNKFYHGSMTYLQGFISGTIISVIIAVLSPLTHFIATEIITPEFFPNAIKYSVNAGLMKQTEAEDYFNLKNYIKVGFVGALMMGIMTTAIVAIFTRGKK